MYFGSVKFFKHLIYFILCSIIIIPMVLAIVFGVKYSHSKVAYASVYADLEVEKNKQPTENEILTYIQQNQVSPINVLKSLEKNGINYIDLVFKEHFNALAPEDDYKNMYPDLYVDAPSKFIYEDNMVYLTFDDGPSDNTLEILQILDKYNIKATFFVTGNAGEKGKAILKEIVDCGHSIGIHTYSHDFNTIYVNMNSFLEDFNNIFNYVYEATGVKPNIVRFAGGSINTYNRFMYQQMCAEVMRRGFVYYDWNVSGEDACLDANWTSIYNNVTKGMKDKERAIILLHDKYNTVLTVEDIIIYIKNKGYSFDRLDHNVQPVTFDYIK